MNNSKLLELLNIYQEQKGQGDSHQNVVDELLNGDSFLLVPSTEDNPENNASASNDKQKAFRITSIFNRDGIVALGAFTDEQGLEQWATKPSKYLAMQSKDVLTFCQKNAINRILINIGLPTMFVLDYKKV